MSDESGHSDCGESGYMCLNCGTHASSLSDIKHQRNCPGCTELSQAPLEPQIRATCAMLADFLVEKNRAYGNSVGEPVGIFARRADPLLQMDVRIDDKINRLKKGSEYPGDDTVKDLAGYLILRMIIAEQQKKEGEK